MSGLSRGLQSHEPASGPRSKAGTVSGYRPRPVLKEVESTNFSGEEQIEPCNQDSVKICAIIPPFLQVTLNNIVVTLLLDIQGLCVFGFSTIWSKDKHFYNHSYGHRVACPS